VGLEGFEPSTSRL